MVDRPYNGFPASYRNKRANQVYGMFKRGEAERPTVCVMCNRTAGDNPLNIHAHTENYHSTTAFVGLCPPCHFAVHRRFFHLEDWYKWRDAVASGWQPPKTRDYRVFRQLFDDCRLKPLGEPDLSNWAYTLPDIEPDLYTSEINNITTS